MLLSYTSCNRLRKAPCSMLHDRYLQGHFCSFCKYAWSSATCTDQSRHRPCRAEHAGSVAQTSSGMMQPLQASRSSFRWMENHLAVVMTVFCDCGPSVCSPVSLSALYCKNSPDINLPKNCHLSTENKFFKHASSAYLNNPRGHDNWTGCFAPVHVLTFLQ